MDFFSVRATLTGRKPRDISWKFRSRSQAKSKFKEICGQFCEEAWFIHWVDDLAVPGKKETILEQHWTRQGGIDTKATSLGFVEVLDDDESLLKFDDDQSDNIARIDSRQYFSDECLGVDRELDRLFSSTPHLPADGTGESAPAVEVDAALRILIVDDEPAILEYLTPMLCRWGHEVISRKLSSKDDANKVIDAVKMNAFDVVITDVMMPGIDGLHLIELLAPLSPTTAFMISDSGACIECSAELNRKGLSVQPLLKPINGQELRELLSTVGLRHGRDFRRLLRGRVRVEAQPSLAEGDRLSKLLESMVIEFARGFELSKIPPELWPSVTSTVQRLVFWGLRTHCLLFESSYRCIEQSINIDALYAKWLVKSLTAHSQLRGYNEDCRGIPNFVFSSVFDSEVEPIQRELGLGWWQRTKNRAKFRNLFDAGILLVMFYDIKAKEMSESHIK